MKTYQLVMTSRRISKRKNKNDPFDDEFMPSSKKQNHPRNTAHDERTKQVEDELREIQECEKEANRKSCKSEGDQILTCKPIEARDDGQFTIVGEINIIQVEEVLIEVNNISADRNNKDGVGSGDVINIIYAENIFREERKILVEKSNEDKIVTTDTINVTRGVEVTYEEDNNEKRIGITNEPNVIQTDILYEEDKNMIGENFRRKKIALMNETNIMKMEEVVDEDTDISSNKNYGGNTKLQNTIDTPHAIDTFAENKIKSSGENDEEKVDKGDQINLIDETIEISTENKNIKTKNTINISNEEVIYEEATHIMDVDADVDNNENKENVNVASYTIEKSNSCDTLDTIPSNTRYIVNMAFLFKQIREKFGRDAHKPFDCTADNMIITGQRWYGLKTEFFVSCKMCGIKRSIWSEPLDGAYVGRRVESTSPE